MEPRIPPPLLPGGGTVSGTDGRWTTGGAGAPSASGPGASGPGAAGPGAAARVDQRQAVAALQGDGLVRIEPGRGTFVQHELLDYVLSRRTRFRKV